ncbi:hypothetical protein [Oceanicola sp. 22II-s10i]|uniref:hypothetical protein n=1 Tax=Oceanicola sp. 22II-s10i TaxID=1317116 RepID=UPI001131AD9C|nr:hypothetical protein [Oceanicola sp. 22II-s10i]
MKLLKVFVVLFSTTLFACTQQSAPETSNYRGERLVIEAEATPGLIDAEFVLKINGQTVIRDRTEPFGGSSQSFSGSYRGQQVMARATAVQKFFSAYTMIDVFINGEHVDTLTV